MMWMRQGRETGFCVAAVNNSSRVIRKEAADWVVALQGDDVTLEELQEFRTWLQNSPMHVGAYFKAESVWLALRQVDASRKVDIDALLRSAVTSNVVPLRPEMQRERSATVDAETGSRSRQRWLAAAGFLVVVSGGILGWALHDPVSRFETGVGEQHTSRLDDGSVVQLNTRSDLRVRYSQEQRRVEVVAGEAFFSVQKNEARPFVVVVDGYEVTAVGTAFNVYRQPEALVVTVSEGIVDLVSTADRARPVRVEAGQQATVSGGRAVLASGPELAEKALAWRQSRLVCVGEPLRNVVAEINRYNERKLIVKDAQLSARRISGVFGVHNPELIVRFLERSAGVAVEESSDGSWLLSEGRVPR